MAVEAEAVDVGAVVEEDVVVDAEEVLPAVTMLPWVAVVVGANPLGPFSEVNALEIDSRR